MAKSIHDNLSFGLGDVPRLHDSCFITGKIIQINKNSNSADVHTDKYGRVNNVDIHYHCDGYTTTEYGYTAFSEEDDVKILCFGARSALNTPDMKIVGFMDGDLRQCVQPALLYVRGEPEKKMEVKYAAPIPPATDTPMFADNDVIICEDWAGRIRKADNNEQSRTGTIYGDIDGCYPEDEFGAVPVFGGDVTSLNKAEIRTCYKRHFADLYEIDEISSGEIFEKITLEKSDRIISPIEFPPHSDVSCKSVAYNQSWFKTYDYMTVAIFISSPDGRAAFEKWSVAATYLGEQVLFPDGSRQHGEYNVSTIRSDGSRMMLYKGFDIWKESGDYFLGIASDNGTLEIFRYDEKHNKFELTESYDSGARTAYSQNAAIAGKDLLRLVGYEKRKRYWCDIPIGYDGYYVENNDQAYLVPNPGPGRILDCLFNQVTGDFYYYFCPAPYSEFKPPSRYSVFQGAETYYNHPYYCTKDMDGSYSGEGCKGLPFIGIAEPILLTRYNVPAIGYYGDSSSPDGHSAATNRVWLENIRTERVLGDVQIAGQRYDQGKIITSSGATAVYRNGQLQGVMTSFANKITIENAKQIVLLRWMWSAGGGCAYEISDSEYIIKDGGAFLDTEHAMSFVNGDSDIVSASSAFPHDLGWTAILKHGTDRKDRAVKAMVIYNGNSRFMMTGSGVKQFDDKFSKRRRFFTTINLKRKP